MTRRRSTRTGAPGMSEAGPRPAAAPAFVPPYPPSWFDRLTDAIDRVPGPAWLTYLVLACLGTAMLVLAAGTSGDYRPGQLLAFHIWIGAQFAYMLALMHYLDRSAGMAFDTFRPVLEGTDGATIDDLRYRLTTLPPRATWLAALAGAAFGLLLPFVFLGTAAGEPRSLSSAFSPFGFPASSAFFVSFLQVFFVAVEAVSATLVFHTVHQLRMISRVYASHKRLNLYRLQPLYAFSVPAGLTAGGLVLYAYAWFGTAPALRSEPISLALGVFFTAVAATTFAWPLLGIHRRLVAEKKRLLAESAERFETTVIELHRRIDHKTLADMDDLNKTLASLEIEQSTLRRIPTWPWEPGTVRSVAAAVLLPVFLFAVQQILSRAFGG